MTAKELAEILLKNPDDIVCVTSSNFEQGHSLKKSPGVHRFKGNIVRENFRDAFDGESYSSEVVEWDDKEGKLSFVQITSL